MTFMQKADVFFQRSFIVCGLSAAVLAPCLWSALLEPQPAVACVHTEALVQLKVQEYALDVAKRAVR